jgi:hypothetical protein
MTNRFFFGFYAILLSCGSYGLAATNKSCFPTPYWTCTSSAGKQIFIQEFNTEIKKTCIGYAAKFNKDDKEFSIQCDRVEAEMLRKEGMHCVKHTPDDGPDCRGGRL